jgi:hypothetical protein
MMGTRAVNVKCIQYCDRTIDLTLVYGKGMHYNSTSVVVCIPPTSTASLLAHVLTANCTAPHNFVTRNVPRMHTFIAALETSEGRLTAAQPAGGNILVSARRSRHAPMLTLP